MPKIGWKWCKGCSHINGMLLTSQFHKKRDARDGLQPRCKDCNKEAVYGYREEKYLELNLKKQTYTKRKMVPTQAP